MNRQNDDEFEVYEQFVFNNALLSKAMIIQGVIDKNGVCEPVQKGEQYDFVSLYFRFLEGNTIVIGDFGKNCLQQLHEKATELSKRYRLPIYSFIQELGFDEIREKSLTPGLSFDSHIDAFWHHCDGEKWQFISIIEIDGIFIAEYRVSHIGISDMSNSIASSDLAISASNCRCVAKSLCDYILKLAIKTKPTDSAHDSYYGV